MNRQMDINLLKFKDMLNQYKDGKKFTDISFDLNMWEFNKAALKLLEVDYFDSYELAFLSQFGDKFKDKLVEKCKNITNEDVMCISRNLPLNNLIHLIKSSYYDMKDTIEFIETHSEKLNRQEIEYNDNVLQIIPYMIITQNDDIVLLEKKKGDSRLINYIDFPAGHCNKDTIKESICTELNEELDINEKSITKITPIGFIPVNENIFSISHYHLGIIFNIELEKDTIIINKEPEKHNILYYSGIKDNAQLLSKLSTWCTYSLYKYLEYLQYSENNK